MRINLGLGLRGPDIRPGPDNRYLIIEGHGRALNVIVIVIGIGKIIVSAQSLLI